MLLLTICDIIFLDTTFIVNFVFIEKKIKNYYNWMLYYLVQLYSSLELSLLLEICIERVI